MDVLRYADLLDLMQQRADRLGLVTNGQSDAAELELYLFQGLLDLTEMVDAPEYVQRNATIAVTTNNQANYPLPEDFGRLIRPRVRNRRGMYLWDTQTTTDLEYIDANIFSRRTVATPARPSQFTVMDRTLWLSPPPDLNGGNDYTIRGTYVRRVPRPDLDEAVILRHPTALVDQALFRLASDMNRVSEGLRQSRQEAVTTFLAGAR